MLCTSVGGLLDPDGNLIRHVPRLTEAVFGVVRTDKSSMGLGGMASKLTFAKLATRMGIRVVIFGLTETDSIRKALDGSIGTQIEPQPMTLSARSRWLGSGSLVVGRVRIDAGAVAALQRRSSLLAVGVVEILGEFSAGEVFEIVDDTDTAIAVAQARLSSFDLAALTSRQNVDVANANDIVLL